MKHTGGALALGLAFGVLAACGSRFVPASTTAEPTTQPVTFLVNGNVHARPTCPVERPDQPCADVPVRGTVEAWRDGQVVKTAATDASGNYSLVLPSGRYELRVDTGAQLPRCEPVTVEGAGQADLVADISCDTGIR